MLGNGRVEAQCFDGEKRLAHIRGKMRKKVIVLLLMFPRSIAACRVVVDGRRDCGQSQGQERKGETRSDLSLHHQRGIAASFSPEGVPFSFSFSLGFFCMCHSDVCALFVGFLLSNHNQARNSHVDILVGFPHRHWNLSIRDNGIAVEGASRGITQKERQTKTTGQATYNTTSIIS